MFTLKSGKKVNLAKIKCRRCNKMGHFQWMKDKCEKAKDDKDKDNDGETFMTVKSDNKFDPNVWVNDDTAQWHVCNSRDAFVDIEKCQGKALGGDKEYEGADIIGIGTVRIVTEDGAKITLKETRYIPSFKTNLISGQRVIDMGCTIKGDEKKLEYMRSGKVVLSMTRYKGYWALKASPKPEMVLFGQSGLAVPLSTWHERFGHVSYEKILKMIKKQSCEGLSVSDIKPPEERCVNCYVGKSKRQLVFLCDKRQEEPAWMGQAYQAEK